MIIVCTCVCVCVPCMFEYKMFCKMKISTFFDTHTIPTSFAQYLHFQFLLNLFFFIFSLCLSRRRHFFSVFRYVCRAWAFYLLCTKLISISSRHACERLSQFDTFLFLSFFLPSSFHSLLRIISFFLVNILRCFVMWKIYFRNEKL